MKPRQPPVARRERCQFHQADVAWEMRPRSRTTSATRPGGGSFNGSRRPEVQGVRRPTTRSRRATSASAASARSRSPTTAPPTPTSPRAAPPHPGRPAEHLALRRLPAARRQPARRARLARGLPAGCTPLVRADRLAERLGLREVWVKNDTANPTHSFKDRVVSVALARARELGLRDARLRLDRQPRQRGRRPRRRRSGCESYVFIPADLEEQKILATGVYGTQPRRRPAATTTTSTGSAPSSRGERELGVRERQPAPVLRRGLQDARLRDRRAARLGAARPRRRADRLRLAVHEDRRAASRSGIELGLRRRATLPAMNGAQAEGCSPVAQAFAAGHDVCRPVKPDTIAKSLAIGNPADGPYALELARRTGGGDRRGHRRRDPRRHPPARRDDRHLHRDRRRRDDRGAGQARRARRHRPRRARRARTSPATA